jgi:glycosyltransferase 2 family protein
MSIPIVQQTPQSQHAPQSNGSRSKVAVLLVAVGLAAVLLYYSLGGIDWRQVWTLISHARPGYVALMCTFASGALFLRALRWRILLSSAGPVPIGTAFWATSVGYFGNNFLPARAGELARTLMISSRCGLTSAYVLTTAMLERMVDALALVIISALVMLTLPSQPDWLAKASRPFAMIGGCGVVLIAVLPRLERFWMATLQRIPMPPGIRDRLSSLLEHILEGFRAFHDTRRTCGFIALTIVIW